MKLEKIFSNLSIRQKLILTYTVTAIIILLADLYVYRNVYQGVSGLDDVFEGNISLSELSESLDTVQYTMTGYLETKSTDDMDAYYKAYQEYSDQIASLPYEVTGERTSRMERNIRTMSDRYLEVTDAAIEAKRGRNIDKYRQQYEAATTLYGYIRVYINSLNNELLNSNSTNYLEMTRSFHFVIVSNVLVFFWITLLNTLLAVIVVRRITHPLATLAQAAGQVEEGNYDVVIPDTNAKDEPGILITAFNRMLDSIRRGVVTEVRLHEAQLRFLQAQINPHFLFNTLNAGAQLAMLEGADRTYEYIQNVADFFRYNIKKQDGPVPLADEITMVDTYIYIINIRFSGEVGYEKEVDPSLLSTPLPAMTLQPIVENAVSHGIRGSSGQGLVRLSVSGEGTYCRIDISDNGAGITEDKLLEIRNGKGAAEGDTGEHSGIGLQNVVSRLRLLYHEEHVFEIESEGPGCGTLVTIRIPLEETKETALITGQEAADTPDH